MLWDAVNIFYVFQKFPQIKYILKELSASGTLSLLALEASPWFIYSVCPPACLQKLPYIPLLPPQ